MTHVTIIGSDLDLTAGRIRRRRLAFSRSQAHRESLRGSQRREPQGHNGPDGTRQERAAIIYQHEAQGADLAITSAIDAHIEAAARSAPGRRSLTRNAAEVGYSAPRGQRESPLTGPHAFGAGSAG